MFFDLLSARWKQGCLTKKKTARRSGHQSYTEQGHDSESSTRIIRKL